MCRQVRKKWYAKGKIKPFRQEEDSLKPKLTPEDLLAVVCDEFDCERETIIRK